eukprot:TRINITY_DN13973_c0_g1_i6.p3 TRINITY_DN13973_c0_g1~~TRINITY_DN13973_c0_g1_i6.p3  ORF type:complete len:293 (+),score=51.43 TRINITY_DN13973_c0_g1_i6:248-1126(+)
MDQIWKHIFTELKVDPKERPVLITQPPLSPYPQLSKLAALFFESYQVPAFFIALQGVLTLYAAGKTTGVVLDSGDGVTYSVPVFEGFALEHAQKRIDLGGRDVTEYLVQLLRRAGYNFSTTAEFELVKKIKEKRCAVNIELSQAEKYFEEKKNKDIYVLPDGELLQLSDEKKQAPEILFNPERIGSEALSITDLIITSIKKTDIDLRKTLYQEIVLAGGNTMFQCFPERILFEMKKLIAKDTYIKIYAPPERNLLCWMGGSILSNLNSFRNMWITKKEYDDEGEAILYKKSF